MDGESVSISIVNDSPLLKLRADICKEGVVNGAAEEEEERELDTSLSSSDEFPTDSARSIAMRKRKIENIVPFLLKRIEEKRMKISQIEDEIAADLLEIDRISNATDRLWEKSRTMMMRRK